VPVALPPDLPPVILIDLVRGVELLSWKVVLESGTMNTVDVS
jgi:hypothetical protein